MGSLWDACDHQLVDEDINLHAKLRYEEVARNGSPARPLDFPAPIVYACQKRHIFARDHRSGNVHSLDNVVIRCEPDRRTGRPAESAYLVKKKLGKSVYGTVWLCIVLKRYNPNNVQERRDAPSNDEEEHIEWESTDDLVVIKSSEWKRIHSLRGRHLEDPIREVSAMQLLGNYHSHVAGAIEVLQDETSLHTVMPYYPEGDLYGRLVSDHSEQGINKSHAEIVANEAQARNWFRQLLDALFHLQRKGVCHRDISLENIVLDENDRLVLIDLGLALRVPYSDPWNHGAVTDVSAGTNRRLMIAQGQGGKLMYAAPEISEGRNVVDAFATDLWSAGVVLFVMLVGMSPFKAALPTDKRYAKISQGGLKDVIAALDIPLSREATHLLQGFFWHDPRRRLTLAEAMEHQWVQGKYLPITNTTLPLTPISTPTQIENSKSSRKRDNAAKSLSPASDKFEVQRRLRFPQRLVEF